MSRITKELATSIAKKLTEKSSLNVDALKKEYGCLIAAIYNEQVPEEVNSAYIKHPKWFYTRSRISFTGFGFHWENVQVEKHVICNSNSDAHLELNAKIADKITKAKRKVDKALEEYRKLFSETENALLALRTYKNIEENIPAAKPFLPPPMSKSLVCNFESLNKKINNQPEVKKEIEQL